MSDLSSETQLNDDWEVTVCSACGTTACWQGVFYCQEYRTANVRQVPIRQLRRTMLESENYWRRDESVKRKLGTAKPLVERRT